MELFSTEIHYLSQAVQKHHLGEARNVHNHNNNNHKLCSAPFTIRPTDQCCITVKVL